MELFCACPFAVASLGWEPAAGGARLTVCVKATFVLAPGLARLAPVQEAVRAEGPTGDAPDLVPYKPRADILFTGHAYAPGGVPTDSLLARARIGPWRKSLSINGDRTWVPSFDGLRPSVPVPFRRMPLAYDRAVRTGENLVGVDISQGAEPNRPLANIAAIADQGGETPGLAPLPFGWRAMRYGLAEAGILWVSRVGVAAGPPPEGFDFRVFNAAPLEQQVDEIPTGAAILLENLHPEHPRLETRLPPLRVKLFQRGARDTASSDVAMRCDTLSIDTDRGLAFALWRGILPAPDPGSRVVVVAEAEGERIGPEDVDRMLARIAPEATYVDGSLARGAPVPLPPLADPVPLPPARETAPPRRRSTTLVPEAEGPPVAHTLPFRPASFDGRDADAGGPPPPFVVPTPRAHDEERTEDTFDDAEVTPPRGHPLPFDANGRASFDDVRREVWQTGEPLGDVLTRRGVDREAFAAHEAARREAVAREAADGGSAIAIAWLTALAGAART